MRALLVIIDSFGVGELPDADLYGDCGANTALHICQGVEEVRWPNLQNLGLGNSSSLLGHMLPGCAAVEMPLASFGVMAELSAGKDTTTGHWELAGIVLENPFTTFPLQYPSFPEELIASLTAQTGYDVLGNKGASGTDIIEELGQAHMNGGGIIVYTSADSVLQIAAHEDIVPLDNQYTICETARKLSDPYRIGRVIARPFTGRPGAFTRTGNRKDFSMLPTHETILDLLQAGGVETIAIGKIGDIFCEQGIDRSYHDSGNSACLDRLASCLEERSGKEQFLFVNLVDTDMNYGHRRDIQGYHDAVQMIDERLSEIVTLLSGEDILIITADHGCDPGFKGSDHTREYVPLLVYSKKQATHDLGVRKCFCDVAQSLASYFKIAPIKNGKSFIKQFT
jgi:phosphopentomutase